jgi:hypothetical protein
MYRVLFEGFNDRAIAQSSRFRTARTCGPVKAKCDSEALLRLRQHGALAKRHEVQQQSADQALLARVIAQRKSLQSRSRAKSEQAKEIRKIQIYRWCCF